NSAWAVSVAGSARSVSSYTISGSTATLTLASAVTTGESVTLGYTKPGSGDKLQDAAGNDLASLSGQAVTNNTPDTTAPTITSITRHTPSSTPTNADSLTWRVTFSEAVTGVDSGIGDFQILNRSLPPPNFSYIGAASLSVVRDGSTNSWDDLELDGDQNITDSAGNALSSTLPDGAQTRYTVDNTAPTVTAAGVDGVTLTVTLSENMGSAKAANSAWAVSVAGSARSVSSYTLSGSTATLTLASAVTTGESVTLGYTKPGSGDKLQDTAGNELASLRGQTVTNNTLPLGDIQVTPAGALTIDEGDSTGATLSVSLSAAPSANVTVSLTKTNSDITLSPASLTFTSTDWDNPQSITVTAAEDADITDDTDTITLSASGGITASSVTKAVAITDNEVLTLSAARLEIDEGGSATFTVKLGSQPTANVKVTLARTGASSTDVMLDETSLTFTTTNWNDTQTVTVRAREDGDIDDDTATISLTASGGGYDSVEGSLTVNVDDNDEVELVLSLTGSLDIDEDDEASFTVKLGSKPTASVTVTLTQTGTANAAVKFDANAGTVGDQDFMTFTAVNWQTTQTVAVRADHDDDPDDDSATIRLTAAKGGYDDITADVTVDVIDDDGRFVMPAELTVAEGGSKDFTVALGARPTGNVTVMLAK
nr:hypothetical protein [Gammaproteobacteria bacterium AqS3]